MRRPSVNLTSLERIVRIVLGVGGVVGGVIALGAAAGTLVVILSVLLLAAGLDLLITGAIGHCPLYRKLGYVPPSLRRQS